LWVDIYSLTGCDFLDENSDVNLRISIGGVGKKISKNPKDTEENRIIPLEYKRKTNCWRYKPIEVKAM
jgi:hypothetical protein